MNLNSNESSNFQARELKSVYTDCVTLLLKVVFQPPFGNYMNQSNQVGLAAVNCMGQMVAHEQMMQTLG